MLKKMILPSNIKWINTGSYLIKEIYKVIEEGNGTIDHIAIINPSESNLKQIIDQIMKDNPGIRISIFGDDGEQLIFNNNMI